MKHGSLFSGIGGFDLAAEWMGWDNVFHCEWNPFGQKVLKHHFPKSISYNDITKTDFTIHRGEIDILTGGFPCQPYSVAGKRKGKEDERHLWPEMLRAIREIQPRYVVGENVSGLLSWSGGLVFEEVQTDLEAEGYEVWAYVLPACGVNAPHRRDRVWFVAYAKSNGDRGGLRRMEGENGSEWQPEERRQDDNESGSNGKKWVIENPHSYGRAGNIGKEESSIGQFGNIGTGNNEWVRANDDEVRPTPHPHNQRNTAGFGQVQRENEEIPERNNNAEFSDAGNGDVANTESKSSGRELQQRQKQGGLGGCYSRIRINDWQNFPTQPPICGGDDGISNRLDFTAVWEGVKVRNPKEYPENYITFAKWRNESIKAYGNAIVPQVAYQIFKSIQETL